MSSSSSTSPRNVSPEDRDKNRITLRLANSIKAQRIIDLQNEIYGVRMINGLGKKHFFRIPLGIVHR